MNKRGWILVGTAVPILAFLALFAWASVKSGSNPGGLGVNDEFGQVDIDVEEARDFSLELLGGETVTLSELRGKVIMLDFWASWCPPCREEAPILSQVYREFQGQAVEFIGIDIWDRPGDAREFVDLFEVPYPNGVDSKGIVAIDYGVKGIPEKIFVDPNGVISKKFVGPINADTLRATLNGLLEGVGATR
jgi:cytochrome c biogenesis protein CcmG/thiol:disulfide interchange protein DsbE